MKFRINGINVEVEIIVPVFLLLSVISIKASDFFSNYYICYLFALFHEMAHIFVASICGINLEKINLTLCGLNATFIKNSKFKNKMSVYWLVTYIAGPISNFILAFVFNKIPLVFEVNMALAIMNLVIIKPLDGYNICDIILSWIFSKKNKTGLLNILNIVSNVLVVVIALILFIQYKNLSVLLLYLYAITYGYIIK